MISTIHGAKIVNTGRKDRKKKKHGNEEALCCSPVQKNHEIHEGHRQGRPVPHYYSVVRKTVK